MKPLSGVTLPLGLVLLTLAVSACGEPSPEKLLEKSEKIPELYRFGELYVPLYQQAVIDSNWSAIRTNMVEIIRRKTEVSRLGVPENRILHRAEWETNRRLFVRAVDNLNIVMGYRGTIEDSLKLEMAEGVQLVYDWWQMLVEFIR